MFSGKKVMLTINEKPEIKTYNHHGFVNSIIDISTLFKINVLELQNKKWFYMAENIDLNTNGNYITAYSDEKHCDTTIFRVERKSEKIDELNAEIIQLNNLQRDAKMIFYISEKKDVKNYNEMNFSLTIHRYGYTSDERGVNRENLKFRIKEYPFIKIIRNYNRIAFKCSSDLDNWINIDECNLVKNFENVYWGIIIVHKNMNEYTEWLLSNYINLSFDPNADMTQIYLDYALAPCKNMRYEFIYPSQFLDVTYLSAGTIEWSNMSEFIKKNIDNGYYVSLSQDEFYIINRKNYQKYHNFHHNMFWGYDDILEKFYILGYGNTYLASEISYSDFLKAGISETANLVLYRVDCNEIVFSFNKKKLLNSLQCFINGETPFESIECIMSTKEKVYGMKVFQVLSETKKGIWITCFDSRAAYLFYEHSVLWSKRIDYLVNQGYLTNKKDPKEMAVKLIEISQKLLFFVQKNIVRVYGNEFQVINEVWFRQNIDELEEKAKMYIKKLEKLEYELISYVISELEEK